MLYFVMEMNNKWLENVQMKMHASDERSYSD